MYALSPIRAVRLYKRVKPTPAKRLHNTISPFIAPSTAIISVSTTELECKIFLKLVSQNALQAITTTVPERERLHTFGDTPLNMHDLGKLSGNFGCEVCGKRAASKCTRCLFVVYAEKVCVDPCITVKASTGSALAKYQTADWKDHKNDRQDAQGRGTWLTIHFERPTTGFSAIMNWYNSSNSPGEQTLRTIESDAAGPPLSAQHPL